MPRVQSLGILRRPPTRESVITNLFHSVNNNLFLSPAPASPRAGEFLYLFFLSHVIYHKHHQHNSSHLLSCFTFHTQMPLSYIPYSYPVFYLCWVNNHLYIFHLLISYQQKMLINHILYCSALHTAQLVL